MPYKILFVDDEENILTALKRLFMDEGYEIFTAQGGLQALELLENESMDLIVSDQRMPVMTGVEFLKQSKMLARDSIRIVLTGYADTNAAIDSINKGEVYRYITKPWNDDEIKAIIRDGLELKRLRRENEELLELTQRQNLELKDLNENLDKKVKEQTRDIQKMLEELQTLYGRLDKGFLDIVRVLSNIIRLREKALSLHLKNTAKLAKAIASKMNLTESEIKDIEIASLLHDIGKIGIGDAILNTPFDNLTTPQRILYMKHPILGQAALQSIENMQGVSLIIRHHHERWDGEGYPDNIKAKEIPVGARILSIATDYDELLAGSLMPSRYTFYEAKQFIMENSGQRYESEIVVLAIPIISIHEIDADQRPELKLSSTELKPGMILSRDIYTVSGLLLLNEGSEITERHIKNIVNFEESQGKRYDIYVTKRNMSS